MAFMCILFVLYSEKFWSEFFVTLSSQSRDGAVLVYMTSSLAQLPPVRVIDNVEAFRSTSVICSADSDCSFHFSLSVSRSRTAY